MLIVIMVAASMYNTRLPWIVIHIDLYIVNHKGTMYPNCEIDRQGSAYLQIGCQQYPREIKCINTISNQNALLGHNVALHNQWNAWYNIECKIRTRYFHQYI